MVNVRVGLVDVIVMNELLSFDGGNPKIPRHFKPSLIDDEFETPNELVIDLCDKYNIRPKLDVAATDKNKKFNKFFTLQDNALEQEWLEDSWCNHPHTLHEQFVEKNYQQWKRHNKNRLMIIPANCGRTKYWHKWIEPFAEYHMIEGAITFLQDGKPTEFASRNAYVSVLWRTRICPLCTNNCGDRTDTGGMCRNCRRYYI